MSLYPNHYKCILSLDLLNPLSQDMSDKRSIGPSVICFRCQLGDGRSGYGGRLLGAYPFRHLAEEVDGERLFNCSKVGQGSVYNSQLTIKYMVVTLRQPDTFAIHHHGSRSHR